jgi:lactate dehydrogenase-like 2-hydroxyacid dehydrogenase
MKTEIIQISSFPPFMVKDLHEQYHVHRWYEIENHDAWLLEHAHAIRGIVTGGNVGVANSLLEKLPSLGIVAISGVGFDKVDLPFAKSRGVRVTYTPDVLTDEVADLAVGLIISLLRELPAADRYVREDRWPSGTFRLGRKVSGRHFGIIGLGRIGAAIASRLATMGPVAYSATAEKTVPYRYVAAPLQLARECDVLILAMAANASTFGLVGRNILNALGPDGILVNVARGSVVNEPELIAALLEKRIAGAALDVFANEPKVPEALRAMPNVVLTPHIGSATLETRAGMARMVLGSLNAYFTGTAVPNTLV